MSLTKGEMKGLANGFVNKEALVSISSAKLDQFELWCQSRPFQHFLKNQAGIDNPSSAVALCRLKEWAADQMFHLLASEVSLSPEKQGANADINMKREEEDEIATKAS
ncbi:hypothetical protein F53441_1271 [Fusarium austroafricanum]|uniref:Uncharacterized protein n=1 Tax=Fusarium austroafricanum TaxID=2364996 RepID=A0A8H4PDI0_9HYPO|nr:hypothetical protein F53441_1271 [Fusarium austroafricanum]